MDFVLIRHTPCEVATGVCYGQIDLPLRASAAEDITNTLRNTPPVEHVFTSPLQRCSKLATALAARDQCELTVLDDLRELHFGAWEGQRWDEIPRTLSDAWAEDPWNRAPPDGESEAMLVARCERAFGFIVKFNRPRIAVVAHGGPLRVLRCMLLGQPLSERWEWSPGFGEVRVFSR